MLRHFKRFPFLTYALLCTISMVLILVLGSFGKGYDDGGIGGIAFGLQLIWCGVAFPFFGPFEALASLQQPTRAILGWCIGMLICGFGEAAFQHWRRRRIAV